MTPDIVRRYTRNPILTKAQIMYAVETVHNAAVVKHQDQQVLYYYQSAIKPPENLVLLKTFANRLVQMYKHESNEKWIDFTVIWMARLTIEKYKNE
jgi:hypothetical protein